MPHGKKASAKGNLEKIEVKKILESHMYLDPPRNLINYFLTNLYTTTDSLQTTGKLMRYFVHRHRHKCTCSTHPTEASFIYLLLYLFIYLFLYLSILRGALAKSTKRSKPFIHIIFYIRTPACNVFCGQVPQWRAWPWKERELYSNPRTLLEYFQITSTIKHYFTYSKS